MVSVNQTIRQLGIDKVATIGYICHALDTLPAAGISIQGCDCVCMLACVSVCVRVLENTHVCVQSPQCVLNFLYLIHK